MTTAKQILWMRSNIVMSIYENCIGMRLMLHVPNEWYGIKYLCYIYTIIYLYGLDWMGSDGISVYTNAVCACTVHAHIRTLTPVYPQNKRDGLGVFVVVKRRLVCHRVSHSSDAELNVFAYPNAIREKTAKKYRSQCEQQNKRNEKKCREREEKSTRNRKRQR